MGPYICLLFGRIWNGARITWVCELSFIISKTFRVCARKWRACNVLNNTPQAESKFMLNILCCAWSVFDSAVFGASSTWFNKVLFTSSHILHINVYSLTLTSHIQRWVNTRWKHDNKIEPNYIVMTQLPIENTTLYGRTPHMRCQFRRTTALFLLLLLLFSHACRDIDDFSDEIWHTSIIWCQMPCHLNYI